MTYEQILERMRQIRAGFEALSGETDRVLSEEEQRQADWYAVEFEELNKAKEAAERRAERIEVIRRASTDPANIESLRRRETPNEDPMGDPASIPDRIRSNPWDAEAIRSASMRGEQDGGYRELFVRGLAAVEKVPGMSSGARERVTQMLERTWLDAEEDGAEFGRYLLTVSSPQYVRAFSKVIKSFGRHGQADVESLQTLQRAMSLTNAAGGYAVALPIDPTLIVDDNLSTNPFRRISNVNKITTNKVRYVTSTAPTFSWDGEAAEVSDDTTTFANIDITAWKAQGFVPFSIEIEGDFPNLTQRLGNLMAVGRDNLEAIAFATGAGDGSTQPYGIVTGLSGTASKFNSATADTFAKADVYAAENKLPSAYAQNARWVANKKTYSLIRQMGGTSLSEFWQNFGGGRPPELMGYPAEESSAMDGVIDAGAENYMLVLGDFSHYDIVDRVGMSVELVPHLFATANNLPSGQRGLYCFWRVGANVTLAKAFQLLDVT